MYQTISEHREKGKTFDQIAEWFNENGSYFKTETYKNGEKID